MNIINFLSLFFNIERRLLFGGWANSAQNTDAVTPHKNVDRQAFPASPVDMETVLVVDSLVG